MKKYIELEDYAAAAQAYDEISMEDRELLNIAPSKGGIWTTAERDMLKAHGAVQQILTQELRENAA